MYEIATLISVAATAVASASVDSVVSAQAMPVPNRMPFEPPWMLSEPVAGIASVNTGTSVPTVGADALLYSFK